MLGGTFLPAFVGVIGYASIKKEFAGLSAVSGYLTSKMIN